MTCKFVLIPYRIPLLALPITVGGTIRRLPNHLLSLSFSVSGPMKILEIAPPSYSPNRMNGLWKKTCFECFLSPLYEKRYWEINLSPAGHWNIYFFKGYREGMADEKRIHALLSKIEINAKSLTLTAVVNLSALAPLHSAIHIGIAAVIKEKNGNLSYWALTHPGLQPDFHRREGFILQI